ncbi:hypothetical protein GHT09_011993 [Marmota monax]|uniref:Uncharacterized protein n=1 Tax=Marmota monax TaxID=9995 RepID=A0A834UY96_MARMO|nr:hypothetical protein GHT09_011993 [Marmota monax]
MSCPPTPPAASLETLRAQCPKWKQATLWFGPRKLSLNNCLQISKGLGLEGWVAHPPSIPVAGMSGVRNGAPRGPKDRTQGHISRPQPDCLALYMDIWPCCSVPSPHAWWLRFL